MCIEDDYKIPHISEAELRALNPLDSLVMYEGLDNRLHKALFMGYGNKDMRGLNTGYIMPRIKDSYVWLVNYPATESEKVFGASPEKVYSV